MLINTTAHEWFREVLGEYRRAANEAGYKGGGSIPGSPDLLPPTQIYGIVLANFPSSFLFLTKNPEFEDSLVCVDGPVHSSQFLAACARLLERKEWDRPPTSGGMFLLPEGIKMRDLLENAMFGWIRDIQMLPFQDPEQEFPIFPDFAPVNGSPVDAVTVCWEIPIALDKLAPKTFAAGLLAQNRAIVRPITGAPPPQPTTPTSAAPIIAPTPSKLRGVYLYPPLYFAKPPRRTIGQAFFDPMRGWTDLVAVSDRLQGVELLVTNQGLVLLDEASGARALETLNTLMGLLALRGVLQFSARESDLVESERTATTDQITSRSTTVATIRNLYHTSLWIGGGGPGRSLYNPTLTQPDEFRALLREFERAAEVEGIPILLRVYLEAATELEFKAAAPAFLLGWFICERIVSDRWNRYLEARKLSANRRENLAKGRDWTASHVIETLNLVGLISDSEYAVLNRLRKVRNDIIHDKGSVAPAVADECLEVASKMIREELANGEQRRLGGPAVEGPA